MAHARSKSSGWDVLVSGVDGLLELLDVSPADLEDDEDQRLELHRVVTSEDAIYVYQDFKACVP